jgi:hypothetical protein
MSLAPHCLTDQQWCSFFIACVDHLAPANVTLGHQPSQGHSWCAYTTFTRLAHDAGYWTHGLPRREDVGSETINDGGIWGQPIPFSDLAHVIIPRTLLWERYDEERIFRHGQEIQPIDELSNVLTGQGIAHKLSPLVLEIKCY